MILILQFDVNAQLLLGVTLLRIVLKQGLLAGYNFDIASFDNATKFVIYYQWRWKGDFTNTISKPAVGDTYIVFDIQMLKTHITAAEPRLLAKEIELLAQGSDIDFNDAFTGRLASAIFQKKFNHTRIRQYVRLFETNPAIDVTKECRKLAVSKLFFW